GVRTGLPPRPLVDVYVLFFFSSRRRHTRLVSDWSSDVCSSDLVNHSTSQIGNAVHDSRRAVVDGAGGVRLVLVVGSNCIAADRQIGRASCRERVKSWGVAGSVNKKKEGRRW